MRNIEQAVVYQMLNLIEEKTSNTELREMFYIIIEGYKATVPMGYYSEVNVCVDGTARNELFHRLKYFVEEAPEIYKKEATLYEKIFKYKENKRMFALLNEAYTIAEDLWFDYLDEQDDAAASVVRSTS